MSDNHRPAFLPRLSVTLDAVTARAVTLAAAERMQSSADFVRDAVAHELSIREAAAIAVVAERGRQAAAALRLANVFSRGPRTLLTKSIVTAAHAAGKARP